MKLLLLILLFCPYILFSQAAIFSIDASNPRNLDSNQVLNEKLSQMEWVINGQKFIASMGEIQIPLTPRTLDTIKFKNKPSDKWETLICNIQKPEKYYFIYNECCGGFDVTDSLGKKFIGQLEFHLTTDSTDTTGTKYMGTLGEGGVFIESQKKTLLLPTCNSPMNPNIYSVSMEEIELCSDSTKTCPDTICLYDVNQKSEPEALNYTIKNYKLKFFYLPLSNEPLHMHYDAILNRIIMW
jgi:hypothetical protein